ncbi:MAG: DUF1836 domain-containing protein [Lachnospiraceae bacterium]|nr:DUF1836 domain-containing protein [Lachnospiraceae bacterium]
MKQPSFSELKTLIEEWSYVEYISPEDIPSIELYMDQITTFMEKHLSGNKRNEEDKILTKTMINNYSKNDLLPPSNKKKYSKNHIILLIYIYYLKNFLSITDIQNLLTPMSENYFEKEDGLTMSTIYSDLIRIESEYGIDIRKSISDIYEIAERECPEDNDYLKTLMLILLLSYDIYVKKQVVEKLIDSIPVKPTGKDTSKEAKQQEKKARGASKQQSRKVRETAKAQAKADKAKSSRQRKAAE